MSPNPLVTVVTPSFNQGNFIRATIESVLAQDYPNLEYIIMDGGSTDETASVVKDYGSRLTFISQRDRGQSDAINQGFQRGKGDVLAWINSDDIYIPGAIATAVCALEENPACGMVYGEGYVIGPDGSMQGRFPHSRPFDLWRLVHLSDYILQQSAYFRRSALEEVGYLDEDLHYAMDWDLFIRIGKKYPVCYIPEYLGCIREHAEAKTSMGGLVRARELHQLLRKHTGMRLPPGSIVYCGDTYLRLAKAWLEESVPTGLSKLSRTLNRGMQMGADLIIGRTLHHAQSLYGDGWAGDRLRYMLPGGDGTIAAAGSIPPSVTQLHGQSLTISANGLCLGQFPVPIGDFELHVPTPRELTDKPLSLEITASRFYRPNPAKGDFRRLAFMLNEIRWL